MPSPLFNVGKGVLLPQDDAARQMMSSLEIGDSIEVDLLDPDDVYLRNRLFLVIGKLAKWRGLSVEEMRTTVMVALGRCDVITLGNGNNVIAVKSMDRRSLKGKKLEALWIDLWRWLRAPERKLPVDLALDLSTIFEKTMTREDEV